MRKIKIFLYLDSLMIGGMHKQVLYLAKHLNRNIFEPVVCTQNTPYGGLREQYQQANCKLIDLQRFEKKLDLSLSFRLLRVLKEEQPDVIFITAAPNLLYYRIAKLFYRKNIILVGSFRALTFWKGHLKKHYQILDNWLARWLYLSSKHIIVNSEALKANYSEVIAVKKDKPIKVIYNGTDFDFKVSREVAEVRKDLKLEEDDIMIIMVARLDPWKDFFTLIEAAKKVTHKDKRARFFLLGEGRLRGELQDKIVEEGLTENVHLLGEKKDVYNYINAADISVLSTNGEGFSNSLLESMAFGKPVIATAAGGNIEMLGSERKYGILVPPKSPDIFAQEIAYLMANESIRLEMGLAAREFITELCSLTKCISSFEEVFSQDLKHLLPQSKPEVAAVLI